MGICRTGLLVGIVLTMAGCVGEAVLGASLLGEKLQQRQRKKDTDEMIAEGQRIAADNRARRAEALRASEEAERARFEQRRKEEKALEAEEAERQRVAKEAADAHEAELVKLRSSPKAVRYTWSAIVCFWEDWRRASKLEAEKERRYGKEFGAVSLAKLYKERQDAELGDVRAKAAREELRSLKAQPITCSDKVVEKVSSCIWNGSEWCGQDDAIFIDFAYELDPELESTDS